jgi:histidinol-phosphate aminotransferase
MEGRMTTGTRAADREAALEIARASYRGISLYNPDRSPARIDLSDNTNTWGVAPAVAAVIHETAVSSVTRYPDLYAAPLKRALGGYLGVAPEQIVTGCGSDDVLDSAIRAFAEPGDRVALPHPSFAAISIFAQMNALQPVFVPLTESLDLDADAMLATGARIIYICSPNNPPGNAMSRAAVERVVERAPGVVIIDEAYAEFAGTSFLDLLARSDRVLISRTMSKAFGLAGLRIGYAAGSPALVAEVEKSRGPYKVNGLAERAALAALGPGLQWARDHVALAVANRERLADELRARGLAPISSAANFVCVPVPDAGARGQRMRARGVAVRPFEGFPPLGPLAATNGSALRISVGPWEMIEEVLAALDATAEGAT